MRARSSRVCVPVNGYCGRCLGELPEEAPAGGAPTNTQERTAGIQMAPLDRSFRNRLGIEDVELKGAVVVVEPGGPAHQAGLEWRCYHPCRPHVRSLG